VTRGIRDAIFLLNSFTFGMFVHVCVKRVRQMRLANDPVFPLKMEKLHRIARLLLQLITSRSQVRILSPPFAVP
jgi:hypothetical protein